MTKPARTYADQEWERMTYTAADPLTVFEDEHVHEWVFCGDCANGDDRCLGCPAHRVDDDVYDGRITPVGGWLLLCGLILAVVVAVVWRVVAK